MQGLDLCYCFFYDYYHSHFVLCNHGLGCPRHELDVEGLMEGGAGWAVGQLLVV
jgi:hypothetical protein